uniref:Uncharacterized protein n=1 Tax=Amphimedon queenslandica TaxID=400682 RepID=A0A1X7T8C3_AMPQE
MPKVPEVKSMSTILGNRRPGFYLRKYSSSLYLFHWDQQLFDAAYSGNIEGMRIALSKGADINWKNPSFAFIQVRTFIGSRCFHEEIRYVPQTQYPIDDTHSPFFLVVD